MNANREKDAVAATVTESGQNKTYLPEVALLGLYFATEVMAVWAALDGRLLGICATIVFGFLLLDQAALVLRRN